jgi:hypothetical protein
MNLNFMKILSFQRWCIEQNSHDRLQHLRLVDSAHYHRDRHHQWKEIPCNFKTFREI